MDSNLGQKLAGELGEIAGWALGMDKSERDNILTLPVSNPVLLALKQEGAIIGDGIKSFVDRCFVQGSETHYGGDLHSWYQAFCKTHSLSAMSYQKFIQRLQRILPKQWHPSEVVWMDGKTKRLRAYWGGLRVQPCFVDLALAKDENIEAGGKPSNQPHIPSWICIKENCRDGGLADLTYFTPPLVSEKTAVSVDLQPLTTLHTQSLRDAKKCDVTSDGAIVESLVPDQDDSKAGKSMLTATFETADDGCKVGKVSKAKVGDRVKIAENYPGDKTFIGTKATVQEDLGKGDVVIGFDVEILVGGKTKTSRVISADYLVVIAAPKSATKSKKPFKVGDRVVVAGDDLYARATGEIIAIRSTPIPGQQEATVKFDKRVHMIESHAFLGNQLMRL